MCINGEGGCAHAGAGIGSCSHIVCCWLVCVLPLFHCLLLFNNLDSVCLAQIILAGTCLPQRGRNILSIYSPPPYPTHTVKSDQARVFVHFSVNKSFDCTFLRHWRKRYKGNIIIVCFCLVCSGSSQLPAFKVSQCSPAAGLTSLLTSFD